MRKFTKNEERWIGLATFIIGIYLIYTDPTNSYNWLEGFLLFAFGISNSSEIRNIFKIIINFVFKKDIFHIEHSNVSKTNIFGKARDVKITQQFFGTTRQVGLDETKLSILKCLNEEFNSQPHSWLSESTLTEKFGLTKEQLSPHIKYMEGKNFIKVHWNLGGGFICQITSDGIDVAK
jgi:hypothetical protein